MVKNIDLAAALRNYRSYPNCRGVSIGGKFSDGQRVSDVVAIQFFVSQKVDPSALKKALPRFVYARQTDGSIDRSKTIATDVIELKNLSLCCGAGDELAKSPFRGSIALLSENEADPGTFGLITCSHVVGDLNASPANHLEFRGGPSDGSCFLFGFTVASSVRAHSALEYDVAWVEIDRFLGTAPTGAVVSQTGQTLSGYASPEVLAFGTEMVAASLTSGVRNVTYESAKSEISGLEDRHGSKVKVSNLFGFKGPVAAEDSGGIVYQDDKAVGMIVAKADDDWLFVHALEDAVNHIAASAGLTLDLL